MGRRSRKRTTTPTTASAHAAPQIAPDAAPSADERMPAAREPRARPGTGATSRRRRDTAPDAPWGSFPLVELCVLAAIALGVAGFVVGGRSGSVLLTAAVLMGSIAGLEVAIREHLGGYRSHTLVLSGTLAVATLAVSFFAHVERGTMLPIAVAVFAAAAFALRAIFKRRSGGFGMRVR
jgi:hypothetical protein